VGRREKNIKRKKRRKTQENILCGPFLALFSPSPGRKKNKKSEGPMGNAEM